MTDRRTRLAACCVALLLAWIVAPLSAGQPEGSEDGGGGATVATPPESGEQVIATSLTQTLAADSGVSVQSLCTNCNNADLSMAGLDNDHVAVTCDGLPVPSGLAQIYLLSVMPPTVIDKVVVKKGAGEPQLPGAAVGGGIEIDRRRPEPGMELNVSADQGEYGWTGSRIDLSGQSGRFGGSLVGSWAKSDLVDANRDGNPNLPSFDRYTVDGTAEVRIARKQRLRFSGNRYDESQKDGPAAFDWFTSMFGAETIYELENVELEREQFDLLYEGEYDEGSRLEVSVIRAERSQDIEETQFSGPFIDTYLIDDRILHAGASWSRPAGQQSMMRAGVSYTRSEYDVVDIRFNQFALALPPDQVASFALEEDVEEWGVWVEGEAAVGGQVDLSLGLRFVAFEYADNEAVLASMVPSRAPWLGIPLPDGDRLLPRAALTWKPAQVFTVRFSAGTGFRSPKPIYDEVCCGRRYRNNRGMLMERSRSYGVETTFQPAPSFRLGGSAFVTDFDDRILRMASLAYFFQPTYQNVNVPQARYRSLSIDTSWRASPRFTFKGSVSWVEADNRTSGNTIPVLIDFFNTPVMKEFTTSAIPYTAERRAAAGLQLKAPRGRVTVGFTVQYTGPMLIQEFIQDSVSNPDLGFSEVQFDSFVSSEDFVIVNVNFSKSLDNGMALFAGVDNLGDYVQSNLGQPQFDYNWGPLRGRYLYGGVSYHFESR